jgi:hypothetical protein
MHSLSLRVWRKAAKCGAEEKEWDQEGEWRAMNWRATDGGSGSEW